MPKQDIAKVTKEEEAKCDAVLKARIEKAEEEKAAVSEGFIFIKKNCFRKHICRETRSSKKDPTMMPHNAISYYAVLFYTT